MVKRDSAGSHSLGYFSSKNLCDTTSNLIDPQTVGKATVFSTMEGIAGSP